MPGLRWATYWEGDRAELFATYILSSVAAVVPVPRPMDFGFDLLCTLVTREDYALYAGKAFGVQVKAASDPNVRYGGLDKQGKWKGYEIEWLYGQHQPLLLCVIDLKQWRLKLYSTSRMWWVRWAKEEPGEVILVPDWDPPEVYGVDPCPRKPLEDKTAGEVCGDGYSYKVPLGNPIIHVYFKEQEVQEYRDVLRRCLDTWLTLDYNNIRHYHMSIPYSQEFDQWESNDPKIVVGRFRHYVSSEQDKYVRTVLLSIVPAIESLIRNLSAQNQHEKIGSIVPIARLAREYGAFFRSEVSRILDEYEVT